MSPKTLIEGPSFFRKGKPLSPPSLHLADLQNESQAAWMAPVGISLVLLLIWMPARRACETALHGLTEITLRLGEIASPTSSVEAFVPGCSSARRATKLSGRSAAEDREGWPDRRQASLCDERRGWDALILRCGKDALIRASPDALHACMPSELHRTFERQAVGYGAWRKVT